MRFATALSALSFVAIGMAQDITITVGAAVTASGGPFQFMPPSVNVTAGSVVTFAFMGAFGNHSVTQSSFSNPCNPLAGGFDSGNILIPLGTTSGFPTWNLTIEEATSPIWFFCKQLAPTPHCKSGMVGAINAPASGNTFQLFQSNAKAFSGIPGQSIGALSGQGAVATAIPGPLQGSITGFGLPASTTTASSGATAGGGGYGGGGTSDAASLVLGLISALFTVILGMMLA